MSFLIVHSIRLALGAVGVLGALFGLPWVPFLSMVLLAIRYPAWEVPFIGLFVDFLWLAPNSAEGFSGSLPLFTIAGLLLIWGFEPLRREFLIGNRV